MDPTLPNLADLIRAHRELRGISQDDLAKAITPTTNRSAVAHLEQAVRLPAPETLTALCTFLQIPHSLWAQFAESDFQKRLQFENALAELVGKPVSLIGHDEAASRAADEQIQSLFGSTRSDPQCFDAFNSLLTFYGARRISKSFFKMYLRAAAFKSVGALEQAVRRFQMDAIRLFSSFEQAFEAMNAAADLAAVLAPLEPRQDAAYRDRTEWNQIETIPDSHLPDLGYIAAARVRQETSERQSISRFLQELATSIKEQGRQAVDAISEKRRRKMDSLLRKFGSSIQHGLVSPLFVPDPDQLTREAEALAPKGTGDLARMELTQQTAQRNLARYLAADHLDVYVATSMRSDADFVSVNSFVKGLFGHEEIRPLKLRQFNPTQSWIEDRVAKGLVEALMLRRSSLTIYMAQKEDTFGKDSEASVALGQGKPVVVFVPKLVVSEVTLDTEQLGRMKENELHDILLREGTEEDREPDDTLDRQALISRIIELRLTKCSEIALAKAARDHWADFDLYGEASRIGDDGLRAKYRSWLDSVVKSGANEEIPADLKPQFVRILLAGAVNFERRATIFREVHPLALQVILSTGVLNGILVVRSVESCARVVAELLRNELKLSLMVDEHNYRLVEVTTGSTIRVISRHRLIRNAFTKFYQS